MDMYDVSVNAANYVVLKVARVCPVALINRSISAELIDLVGWIKLNSWSNPWLGVNPGLISANRGCEDNFIVTQNLTRSK